MSTRGVQSRRFSFRDLTRRLMEWKVNHPKTALGTIALFTILLVWPLPRLTVRTSIYDLVIDDLPSTKEYRAFQQIFGSDDIIRVVIKGDNVFEPAFFEAVAHIAAASEGIDGIRRVLSLPGIKKDIDPRDEMSLKRFKDICAPVTLFRNNLLSPDARTTAITLILDETADTGAVIDGVNRLIAENGSEWPLYQIGIPLVSRALAEYTGTDLKHVLPITFILIVTLLFLIYRNVWLVVLPLLCVTLALGWTFGLMAWLNVSLTMLTLIVPVFILAVGTAYCLHLCSAFLDHTRREDVSAKAVLDTFTEMYLPTILAVVTTTVGLGSLLINRIVAIQEFALFASIGMFSLLIIILWVLPAAFSLIPRNRFQRRHPGELGRWIDRFLGTAIRINLQYQRRGMLALGAIALAAVPGLFLIQVETNPVEYFKRSTEISRHFHDIYQDLSGSFPVQVIMAHDEEDYFETAEALAKLEQLQLFLTTLPKVDKSVSFADYMRLVNYVTNRYDPTYYALPEESFEVRMLINSYKTVLGTDMLTPFMSGDYAASSILLLTHLSSSREFLETRRRIMEHAAEVFSDDTTITVTGIGTVMAESSHHLVNGQIKSLFLTAGIVFTIMFILFLSARVGLVAILVNFYPVLITFGVMGWFGIELNMATGLIASIAIGLAVDDTIHYLTRYNREFKKDLDKDRALRDTLASVGRPMVFTTAVLGLSFSILLSSHFVPTAVFGFLMLITLVSALAGDLILLPSLMLHVELVTAWDLLRLMPSVSGMSAGVAHELKQPLTAIKMGSDYLKIMLQQGDKVATRALEDAVNEISAQVDRASNIINRLSVFGEKPAFARETVNINQPILDTAAVLTHQLALDNIRIELELAKQLPTIQAHHHRLGQVFYNLIVNASEAIIKRKATDPECEGVIRIRTRDEGEFVVAAINDTGSGIPAHLRERVFEPFFTTKETGKGKGLGLSISLEIVRDYDGRIDIESKKSVGTTITLTFPVSSR